MLINESVYPRPRLSMTIDSLEQKIVWIVWDHPAMGIDSIPLRAYLSEADAHDSMGSYQHDDFYHKQIALIERDRAYFFPDDQSNLIWVPLIFPK